MDIRSYPSRQRSDGLDHRRRLEHERGALLPAQPRKLCKTFTRDIPVSDDHAGVSDYTSVPVDEFLEKQDKMKYKTIGSRTGRYGISDSTAREYIQPEERHEF